MNDRRVPRCAAEIQLFVLVIERLIPGRIEPNDAGKDVRAAERVIDQIVIRRILIDTAAKWTVDARIREVMPDFGRLRVGGAL